MSLGPWRLVVPALWAPVLVLVAHVVLDAGFDVYTARPWLDGPMHVCGGLAIAYVIATALTARDRESPHGRLPGVLEHVLIVTGTATAAILWEFAEFGVDRVFGTNLQVSLANTMKDLAMGVLGGALVSAARWVAARSRSPA